MRDLSPPHVLLLDIETSGLYQDRLSIDDPAQPWAVSAAAATCNPAGGILNHFACIVKAEGRTIKEAAFKVHGINERVASQVGVPEARVLGLLCDLLKTTPVEHMKVVTYGTFDQRVIASLLARFAISQGKPSSAYDRLWLRRPLTEFVNLMSPWCQQLCKLPSAVDFSTEYKFPSLDEAAEIILGRPPRTGHHDAWEDLIIMKEIFFNLQGRGFFEQEAAA